MDGNSSTENAEQPEPDLHHEYYDESGDIEIVSSDNILFKLHQYELKTWSPVFRDMIESIPSTDTPRLRLVDDKVEESDVIQAMIHFLRDRGTLSYYNEKTYDDEEPERETIVNLLQFGRKYEIDNIKHLISLQLRMTIVDPPHRNEVSLWHLRLALALESELLAGLVVAAGIRTAHEPHGSDDFPINKNGSLANRPDCMQQYLRIPSIVVWVIMQVAREWSESGHVPSPDTLYGDGETVQKRMRQAGGHFTLKG